MSNTDPTPTCAHTAMSTSMASLTGLVELCSSPYKDPVHSSMTKHSLGALQHAPRNLTMF